MLIHEIVIDGLLSFGPDSPPLRLRDLNVLIGPNGSGKSNLIDVIGLLQAAPRKLSVPIREGGGIQEWIWKGKEKPNATIEVIVDYPDGKPPLYHMLAFTESGQRFSLVGERIYDVKPEGAGKSRPGEKAPFHYRLKNNRPALKAKGEPKPRKLRPDEIEPDESILSQRKDPDQFPELTWLGDQYDRIRIYREWCFGRSTIVRQAQRADQRNDRLEENWSNLGLILNRTKRQPRVRKKLLAMLDQLYAGIENFDVIVEAGSVQVLFEEHGFTISATRLSDGTLRFLCLAVLLSDPDPPPLICIEEPEVGLHPDAIIAIAGLLKEASERTQLIVTTHSDILVDALSDRPEDVVVCEKHDGQTVMTRLEEPKLREWLKEYGLGHLWISGQIGGNRW